MCQRGVQDLSKDCHHLAGGGRTSVQTLQNGMIVIWQPHRVLVSCTAFRQTARLASLSPKPLMKTTFVSLFAILCLIVAAHHGAAAPGNGFAVVGDDEKI